MCPIVMLLLRSDGKPTRLGSPEEADSRPAAPEGLQGRLYEKLDIVDAALPRVSCLPMIPAFDSSLHATVVCWVEPYIHFMKTITKLAHGAGSVHSIFYACGMMALSLSLSMLT